jgi:hypothetical protein
MEYKVDWLADGINRQTQNTSSTSISLKGLENGTLYTVEVRAVNGLILSNPGTITGRPGFPPARPDISEISNGTLLGQVHVTWQVETGVTNFKIFYNTSRTTPSDSDGTSIGLRAYHTFNGNHSTEYNVWIAAENIIGWSEWSDVSTFTTRAPIVPDVPVVTLTPSNEQLTVSWEPDNTADKYEVEWWLSASPATRTVVETTAISITVTGLKNEQDYSFRVRAGSRDAAFGRTNEIGWSTWSNEKTEMPEEWANVPAAPVNVRFYVAPRNELSVRWDATPGATSYEVKYRQLGTIPWVELQGSSEGRWTTTYVRIIDLLDDTEYEVMVTIIIVVMEILQQ